MRTIMPGCLGMRGFLQNTPRTNLLSILVPHPFILLLRLGCIPNPLPPFAVQGHLRRDVEFGSSLHHAPTVFKYGEGGSLSSSSLDETLPVEE